MRDPDEPAPVAHPLVLRLQRHSFVVMLVASIAIALMLVAVAMSLYASSGAAQLDLSRPGFSAVRSSVDKSDNFDTFPSTGPITEQTLRDFDKLYTAKSKEVDAVDDFGGDVLSDKSLGIDDSQAAASSDATN